MISEFEFDPSIGYLYVSLQALAAVRKLRSPRGDAVETLALEVELPHGGADLDVEEVKAPKRLRMGDLVVHVTGVAVPELVIELLRLW